MTRDPQSGVELLGDALPYADGAEDELIGILARAGDRSSSSDELAAHIHDWPTRYHLSRQRSNLLRPLTIRPGMRVLDVGAGTGALARYLGEEGADVLALEGSLARARAAAIRCEGLPNVRVACGSLDDLRDEGPFELVLVVGVLEYSGHTFGGARGPVSFLQSVRRLTAADGAVALAIENQLGLKYLLGYAEDHLGAPWVGVEGYRAPSGIRTWSRRSLARLLDEADLPPRRWLYPYPDYKLPSTVLAEKCFAEPDAFLLADQLVRTPVVDHAHPPIRFCDERAAAQSFVEAGLGEEVANSFLVLAGEATAVDRLVDDDVGAWLFGGERLSPWLRTKRLVHRPGERTVETTPRLDVVRHRAWLAQDTPASEPFVAGPTLERLALDALARHDVDAFAALLTSWRDHVAAAATAVDGLPDVPVHPFLRPTTRRVLPEDHLDVELANFVHAGDGALAYVDREWRALGGVDLDLALTRALWSFAHRLIVSGAELPWSPTITVDELTVTLGSLCGFAVGPGTLEDWRTAEDSLQELVVGLDRQVGGPQRVSDGQVSRARFPGVAGVPFTALRRDVVSLRGEIESLQQQTAVADSRAVTAEKDLEGARGELDDAKNELAGLHHRLADVSTALAATGEELARHRARAALFERRLLVRVYRRLLRRRPSV